MSSQVPLSCRLVKTRSFDTFVREKRCLLSEPGVEIPFYLLMPKRDEGPRPLVLTPHGHGRRGKEVYVGDFESEGNSGGGTVSLFAAALDERINVAVPSSYFCTFAASFVSVHHCPCNIVPGVMALGEMYDIAGLIAPRPSLMVNEKKASAAVRRDPPGREQVACAQNAAIGAAPGSLVRSRRRRVFCRF